MGGFRSCAPSDLDRAAEGECEMLITPLRRKVYRSDSEQTAPTRSRLEATGIRHRPRHHVPPCTQPFQPNDPSHGPSDSSPQSADPSPHAVDPSDPSDPTSNDPASQRRDHHATYFLLYTQPPIVRQLLELLGPEWVDAEQVDFDRLRRLPGQFVTRDKKRRRLDVAWIAPYGNGKAHVVCVMEFQSSEDPNMPVRLNEYGSLTMDTLIRDGYMERCDHMPHGLSLVIYNGKEEWKGRGASGMEGPSPGPKGLPVRPYPWLHFCLIDMFRLPADHVGRDTLLWLLGLAETAGTPEAVIEVIERAMKQYPLPVYGELHRALVPWTGEALKRWDVPREILDRITKLEEVKPMIGAAVERARARDRAEAREEGWVEGRAEERIATTAEYVTMVVRRKPGVDEERLSELLDVTNGAAGNGALMNAALDAETFEDFEAAVHRLIKEAGGK